MFLLLAIVSGLIVGWARGGSWSKLASLSLRCSWPIPIALLLQVVALSSQFEHLGWSDRFGPPLYVFSILLLLLAAGLNLSLVGMRILGLGLLLNFLVIAANGGYMPVSPDNLVRGGLFHQAELLRARGHFSNSTLLTNQTRLPFLADVFFIPVPLPLRSVFSPRDVFIAIGGFVLAMRAMQGKGQS